MCPYSPLSPAAAASEEEREATTAMSSEICGSGVGRDPVADMQWALATQPPDFLSLVTLVQRVGKPVVSVVGGELERTPLHIAALYAKVAYAAMLCNRGADPEAKDKFHWTPLMSAAFGCSQSQVGSLAIVKLLLTYNVSVNSQCIHGSNSLHVSASYGNIELVELLIRHGADLTSRDWMGETPLHKAALRGNVQILDLLIVSGARKDMRANDGSTPLDLAIAQDDPELAGVIARLRI